jgi:4-hydroxy-3-polyprenylbenzoate decarboxylase
VRECWDPSRDTLFSEGPIDVLDHAPTLMGVGGKLGIDATRPWASEGREQHAPGTADADAVERAARAVGASDVHVVADAGLAIVAVDKQRAFHAREVFDNLAVDHAVAGIKLVLLVDAHVDVRDLSQVAFRAFGNTDPVRDALRPHAGTLLGIDATTKRADEGYVRDWPSDIVMTEAIKQRVDDRWSEYGIPTPGARTAPLIGLAEGERRIAPEHTARGAGGPGNADMAREGIETAARR